MRVLLALLLFLSTPLYAGPSPTPVKPNALKLTQGTVTRMLPVNPPCLKCTYTEVTQGGQRRFGGGSLGGGWVQFPTSGGPVATQWITPTATCPAVPPDAAQDATCPNGQGTFHQTHGWAQSAPPACTLTALPWTPATPPAGTCEGTPPFAWRAPLPSAGFTMPTKPAKNATLMGPYGVPWTRVTDHTTDIPGQSYLRNDYSRRQPFNADDSYFISYEPDGFWNLFDARTNAFVRRLNGPGGGDAEIQWDVSDPRVLYYTQNTGGTAINRLDVSTNTHTVQYDFTADVHALWPTAAHCWTKSEGSPTADGARWGLMCETQNYSPLGFMVVDIVARRITWSMPNSVRPDNVSITPSGRWFVRSGNDSQGTRAYATDGSGQTRQLHHKVEHADLGVLSNGHDFYVAQNYEANGGPIFATDIDTGAALPIHIDIYHNPIFGGSADPGNSNCPQCAGHFSAKAFRKPGWVLYGAYGPAPTGPSNLLVFNVETGAVYGLNALYLTDLDYFDEAHCATNRDFTKALCNLNFTQSLNVDEYRIDIPALPN